MNNEEYYQKEYNQPSICTSETCKFPEEHEAEMRREIARLSIKAYEEKSNYDSDAAMMTWQYAFEQENELRRHQVARYEHLLDKYREMSKLQKQLTEVDAAMVRSLFQ